jgi:hypothetical protein
MDQAHGAHRQRDSDTGADQYPLSRLQDDVLGGAQITSKLTFEGEGALKPVCAAEQMTRVYTR